MKITPLGLQEPPFSPVQKRQNDGLRTVETAAAESSDLMILRTAASKLHANVDRQIKNSTAYTMATIFNCIAESESDLMVDPYLNRLDSPVHQRPEPADWKRGAADHVLCRGGPLPGLDCHPRLGAEKRQMYGKILSKW